jgi:hypothetical protein
VDHVVFFGGQDRDDDGSGGGFSGFGFTIAKGSPEGEAAALAEIRERYGDDMADNFQGSRERVRHPRPLTDSERSVIRNAAAPVLRDMEASGAIVPEILH